MERLQYPPIPNLLVTWPYVDADGVRRVQREAIELKVWRDGRKGPLDTTRA